MGNVASRIVRLLGLLVLILPGHRAAARDGVEWAWIAESVGKSSNGVVTDGRWRSLLRELVPPVKLDLGLARRAIPVADSVVELLGGPADDVVLAKGLVRVSACRQHSCPEKAVAVLDVTRRQATLALVHFKLGDQAVESEPMLLVVANAPAPPPGHLAEIEAWLAEKQLAPKVRRLLRPGGEVVNLDAPAMETLEAMFGFDWTTPARVRCAPFKALRIADPATCWLGGDTSFLPVDGKWYRCQVKKAEIMLYPSEKVCQAQLETMQANGP
jgi:hypothetical protein